MNNRFQGVVLPPGALIGPGSVRSAQSRLAKEAAEAVVREGEQDVARLVSTGAEGAKRLRALKLFSALSPAAKVYEFGDDWLWGDGDKQIARIERGMRLILTEEGDVRLDYTAEIYVPRLSWVWGFSFEAPTGRQLSPSGVSQVPFYFAHKWSSGPGHTWVGLDSSDGNIWSRNGAWVRHDFGVLHTVRIQAFLSYGTIDVWDGVPLLL